MTVRVRIAPSPTGNLHIGTARTALFNWLFARHNGGEFILRIEDTDLERSKKEYEANIVEGLKWLGLDWDNDVIARQTERVPIYKEYLERLLKEGKAAWREYSKEEKAEMEKEGRTVRDKVIILKLSGDPEREISFEDVIRGLVSVRLKDIGQLIIAKDLDTPLYHFAAVVDDIDMDITHVIRGEEHISNTPKQLLIYEALDAQPPKFAHLPLILNPDRSKMSKRFGSTAVSEYQKDYLAEAFVNFIGLLGYTYDQEMLTMEEMARQFDLAKVHKSGAIFDIKKLNWFNAQYIRRLTPKQFKELIHKPELTDDAVMIITERLERLSDVDQFSYLWQRPVYDTELLSWKDSGSRDTAQALEMIKELVERKDLTQTNLDDLAANNFNGQKGRVYWPLRVALSGLHNSAGPLEIAQAIGPDEVEGRIDAALNKLK